ncbi:hypothetical protein BD324DRAFT_652738 [Kockovaella imperatae]|uniref:Uncharacterized protein n=1 Tax=Kockovaella imperatae TaxID=4999 RepID=A0A1Y1UAH0_9TREE|nr:hypothetical protein BD324DRAFT_652738 [Kockovaella imperatae]ORX35019.1 hypothetical protein BD324DRAFT_652738 [Kockovaella imperatae]
MPTPKWYPQTQNPQSFHYRTSGRPRDANKPVDPKTLLPLPSMDQHTYYDSPASPSSSSTSSSASDLPFADNVPSNSGKKKIISSRFARRGKMYAWAPSYEAVKVDYRVRKRMKACMECFLPEAAAEVGVAPPANILRAETRREKRKRKREEDSEWVLPHLKSPSPPLSTGKLAPMLALPQSYVDIMLSPAMRHSLEDDTVENGLQGTTQELLEGEKGLMQACGRLREILRLRDRDVQVAKVAESNSNHEQPNGHSEVEVDSDETSNNAIAGPSSSSRAASVAAPDRNEQIPPLPHVTDVDNLWRVTQELLMAVPAPTIKYAATKPGTAAPVNGVPEPIVTATPVQRLFTCPDGITIMAEPAANAPGMAFSASHPGRPRTIKYNLDMAAQCRAVDDALERVAELLADCMEYKERLEEARDRVADVARARKRIWGVVKERAGFEMDRM